MGNCVSKASSSIRHRLLLAVILILFSAPLLAAADDPYSWDDCHDRVNAIRNGTLTWDGISQKNIEDFIYYGDVRVLDGSYPRDQYLLLKYDGCRRICGESHIAYNKPTNILNILATWVFPLAIALGLPFESYHTRRVHRTQAAILSWLGSPQTALTSAIDNFRQTRECYRRTRAASTGQTWENAYYILSCLNQFQLHIRGRGEGVNNNNTGTAGSGPEEAGIADQLTDEEMFLQTLVYGLFRPLSNVSLAGVDATDAIPPPANGDGLPAGAIPLQNLNGPPAQPGPGQAPVRRLNNQQTASLRRIEKAEIQLATELLSALAFQLRMHRRRGVVPTLASLGTFLMAFIFSCVLAFGYLSDSTTIFVLDLGMFFSWLPVLVIFAIVDSNPVSSERQATLMSRWLYNVNEVRKWSESARNSVLNPVPAGPAAPGAQPIHLIQNTHRSPAPQAPLTVRDAARQVGWWTPYQAEDDLGAFQIGSFIGQGRSLEYCGLASATLACTKRGRFSKWTSETPRDLARDIASQLRGFSPKSWYITALICLIIVWVEVGLATMADYITPTVGLGCWNLIFLGYGFFSSVSWFIQFFTLPSGSQGWLKRGVMTWISHVFNGIAVPWIVLIIVLLASGMLNNCFCNSCMPGFTGAGGYTDLESSFAFYRDHYGLTRPWTIAAVVGASVPVIAFIVALFWWRGCSHLWAASEHGVEQSETDRRPATIDMLWLGE